MTSLALLNVLLVTDNIVSSGGKVSPTLVLASSFQVEPPNPIYRTIVQ